MRDDRCAGRKKKVGPAHPLSRTGWLRGNNGRSVLGSVHLRVAGVGGHSAHPASERNKRIIFEALGSLSS